MSCTTGNGLCAGGSRGVSEVGECSDVENAVSSVVSAVVGMPDHNLMSEE